MSTRQPSPAAITPSSGLAILLLLGGLATPVHAAAPNQSYHGIPEPAVQFARERYEDGKTLLFGPQRQPAPAVPANLSCNELYRRRVALMQTEVDYKPAYWDDPRNQAAIFLGTIFTPAFYFLGYTAVADYLDTSRRIDPQVELDALRVASAELHCFER